MNLHLILLLTFGLVFTACGGNGSGTSTSDARDIAQTKIEAYANDNSEPVPTVQDYADAGVSGVTAENLAKINAVVDDLEAEDVDTAEEINALVTSLGINIVPIANAQNITLDEDTSKAVTLTATDVDGDTLTYTVVANPTNGTLSGTAPSLTYTPTANYFGSDSFTFRVSDGTDDSVVQTVSITVNEVEEVTVTPTPIPTPTANVAPIATAQAVTVDEDTTNNEINLTATDVDGDTLSYTVVATPSHGTLSGTAPSLTYTPTVNYFGTDSFTFSVNDGTVDSALATVAITVNDVAEAVLPKKTGQTTSYDADGNVVADGTQRDDGHYQKGTTPSYTRDDVNETVLDNITGLMWQDNAAVASVQKQWLSDANYNTCDSDKADPACFDTTGDTATTYCTELVMGGYEDWRLPTSVELEGIVNYGASNPAIDTTKFQHTASSLYWSSTSIVDDEGYAWLVHFYNGNVDGDVKNHNYYVRCVRDGQ